LVREEKIKEVEELDKLIEEYPVIGLIDMFKLPSKQLQEIRKNLREKALIKMTKKSLLELAIKKSKKQGIDELEKLIPEQPAIVFTKLDPFKFYSMVEKLRSPAFAKEGDIVQIDIKVSAGPTSLLPGPVISELTRVGIPAGIEEGRIAIKKDVIVAKGGEKISKYLAAALRKLKIESIEVGLNIVVIFDGKIYGKDLLELVIIYPEKLKEGFNQALNLSVNISYPTKENIKYLLVKAFNTAKSLVRLGGAS